MAILFGAGRFKATDKANDPIPGAFLAFYATNTSTFQPIYADSALTTLLPNPVQADANGLFSEIWLDDSLNPYKVVHTAPDINIPSQPGSIIWTSPQYNAIPSTAQLLVQINPITNVERSQSVTVVDYSYPAGYVDRYGINATPGNTDMSAAFNTAVNVASHLGCKVRFGATAPYRLNNPVNCTGIHGVIFEDESSGSISNSNFVSITVGHNGHAFDLATSYECTFNNLCFGTAPGSVPKSLFFCARNVAGSDAGLHRFNNVRATNCTCSFIYYGYGSEQNNFINCCIENNQPGATLFSHNATNPSNYTSTFVTIATGSQSNAVHRHSGGSYFNFGNSGSHNEYIFALDNAMNFTFRDGLWGCAHGGGYVLVQQTACINITFDSIRGEPLSTQPTNGVTITATNGVNIGWTFNNVTGDTSGFFLNTVSGTSIQNLAMRATTTTSGNLVLVYNLSNSVIETMIDSGVAGQVGGNVSSNVFIGGRNNVTLTGVTITTPNIYIDNFTGTVGFDNDSITTSSSACTGALTTSISYKMVIAPNGKQVTCRLPSIQGMTTAAASFALAVAIPAQYRPSSNLRNLVAIVDNGSTLNQPGQVVINASTGVISIFKDIVGTGNWTNGTTGGLASETDLTWSI